MAEHEKIDLEVEVRRRGVGRITRKSGSTKLYVDFFYLGERIEMTSGLDDTPENRTGLDKWLKRRMREINEGNFRFEKAFPHASQRRKEHFATLEGREYKPESDRVLFGEYLETWVENVLERMGASTKIDYLSSINPWIRPFFAHMTFFQINSEVVNKFTDQLVHPQTDEQKAAGIPPKPFSKKRVKNILSHMRRIWETACECNRWGNLPSPFPQPEKRSVEPKGNERPVKDIKVLEITEEQLSRGTKYEIEAKRLPLRVDEYSSVYELLDPWYQPIAEFMLLTGMIPSEVAGLCEGHIVNGYIHVRQIISRGVLRDYPKTSSRIRDIRITRRIQHLLDIFINRHTGPFVVTTHTGHHLTHGEFYEPWIEAVKLSGIKYRVPYCLRHSFAAWSLCIGADMNRMVALMGHATKEMIFKTYGKYTEDLEQGREKILELFGEDFLAPGV